MSTLGPLLTNYRRSLSSNAPSGTVETGVPGVLFFWIDNDTPRSPLLYDSGIVIVGQGHKVAYIGGRSFNYDADSCLVIGVPIPLECASFANEDAPLLGIRLDIDRGLLHRLVARLAAPNDARSAVTRAAQSGIEPLKMDGLLLAAVARLVQSLPDPVERDVIGPAAVEEIIYRILRSEQGEILRTLTEQTPYGGIANALELMHVSYANGLSVEDLAKEAAMGVSSFHRAFKRVTGESPLQYLKKVRLLKAKNLLVFEGKRVEETAYDVGYASPSQFSRDFKRYFEVPPSAAKSLPYSDGVQSNLALV